MILCRVTGDVVSTVKNEKLAGQKLLLVQPVELDGRSAMGSSFIAVDLVQAGAGDLVLVLQEGSGVRLVFQDEKIPLEAVVLACVDELELADEARLVGLSNLEVARAAGDDA